MSEISRFQKKHGNSKIVEDFDELLEEAVSIIAPNRLDFKIAIQADLAAFTRDLPDILHVLANYNPSSWRFEFSEASDIYEEIDRARSFKRGKQDRKPLSWVVTELIIRDILRYLSAVSVTYENGQLPELVLHGEIKPKSATRKPFDEYGACFHSHILDYRKAIPILQNLARAIVDREGYLVVCYHDNRGYYSSQGLIFTPGKFSELSLEDVVSVDSSINGRFQ